MINQRRREGKAKEKFGQKEMGSHLACFGGQI